MSLLFSRISKLSGQPRVAKARFFSSSPYCPLSGGTVKKSSSKDDKLVFNYRVFDPMTEEVVTSCEKKASGNLFDLQSLVGASQGWVTSIGLKDNSLTLTDLFKPSVSSPRVIPLPNLGFFPTPYATSLSLSSTCPDQDQDFTVAATFHATHLSLCKPFWDSEWTHIGISVPLLPPSALMFSNRDKAFHFMTDKGLYMGSLHLNQKKKILKYKQVNLCNLPKTPEAAWEMLDNCFTSKHLVESPSGELLLVKWYTQCVHNEEKEDGNAKGFHSKTKRFMVFREQDEKSKDFSYTQDIGDLCIFLGKSEAFCLTASTYPGLKPNHVYFIGHGLGSYDLATGTVHSFNPHHAPMLDNAPFWIPSDL